MAKPKTIVIEAQLLESNAFWALPDTAAKVLLCFYRKRRMNKIGRRGKEQWIVENNGEIIFTYTEAQKKFGLTRTRFNRALEALVEKGFIDIAHHGGGLMSDCTKYWISDRWRKYGKPDFIPKHRPKDTRGLGFTQKNWEERTGKKRKPKAKTSNNFITWPSNDFDTGAIPNGKPPSNKNATGENGHKFIFLKPK